MAPRPISTRLSAFRFSLSSVRSPVSPISPQVPKLTHIDESSSSSGSGSPEPGRHDKEPAVTVVDSDDIHALRPPRALPTPAHSPITPWHATFHRHAATTDQETSYLRQTSLLRLARLLLSILLFSTAATVTGLTSDVVHHYNSTHLTRTLHLTLWPTDINLIPTLLALITSGTITLMALIATILVLVPSPNPRTKLNKTIFTLLCTLGTSSSLSTLVYNSIISPAAIFSTFVSSTLTSLVTTTGPSSTVGLTPNGQGPNPKAETIQSFTCTIANSAKTFNKDATVLQLPTVSSVSDLVPSGFSRICKENKAGLAILVVILGLSVIGLCVAVASWVIESKIERLRGEREVYASRHGSRDGKVDERNLPESLVGMRYEKTKVQDV